jgi:hypothetical protein
MRHTAPETSGPTVEIASLGGLTVTAQAITTIEDEVRVALPDAHVEVSFLSNDLTRSDPANLITRLERHIHRLPDTIAELGGEASNARAEARRAEARLGAPWERADELGGLRRRQKEIEDQLAATAEPVPDQHSADLVSESMMDSSTPVEPQRVAPAAGSSTADAAAAARITARLDALQNRSRVESPGVEM